MPKLKREAHGLYIRFGSMNPWFLIGSGMDELTVEMNGSFEQKKDVTGNNSVSDTGYNVQIGVDGYKADTTDAIYDTLKDLAMNRKSGDDCKAEILEVLIDDTEDAQHDGWTEDVMVEITSYGGDTSGFAINYNLWANGNRKPVNVTMENKVPTVAV